MSELTCQRPAIVEESVPDLFSRDRATAHVSHRWPMRLVWIASSLYLGVVVGASFCLWSTADRHWTGTLLEFGPRWLLLAPVALVAFAALVWDRRLTWMAGLVLLIGGGPWLGLCIPVAKLASKRASYDSMRLLTLNTDGLTDPKLLGDLLFEAAPDIVVLQESYRSEQWHSLFAGWHIQEQGEYFIASRFPLTSCESLVPDRSRPWECPAVRCEVAFPRGNGHLVVVHTNSPRSGLAAVRHHPLQGLPELRQNMLQRQKEAEAICAWIRDLPGPILLAGDFNQTADSAAYAASWGNYQNAFSTAGWGWGGTFFTRWHAVRIDHILASRHWHVAECWPAQDVGSAHRPLIATLTAVEP